MRGGKAGQHAGQGPEMGWTGSSPLRKSDDWIGKAKKGTAALRGKIGADIFGLPLQKMHQKVNRAPPGQVLLLPRPEPRRGRLCALQLHMRFVPPP